MKPKQAKRGKTQVKKVLVTGAAGQVGVELVRLAPEQVEVQAYDSATLDITDAGKLQQELARQQPDLVINAAAYTAVDLAQSEREQAFAVNARAVETMARAVAGTGAALFHLSTDYVFAGDGSRPYREQDPAAPLSVYGASKLAGEQALAAALPQHLIVRTSWVFGAQGSNFVKTMLRLAAERDQLAVVADQRGCPTSAASIATALWQLAQRYFAAGVLPWGTYHFCNAPACSWHEFAVEIFRQAQAVRLLDDVPVVTPIASADYPTAAPRPAYSVLDCGKLEQLLGRQMPQWQQELVLVLQQLKVGQTRLNKQKQQ